MRNIPYAEARKIVEGHIKKTKPILKSPQTTQNKRVKKKGENYQELISKLLQLGPQD